MPTVRIGISGWRYPPWRGTFYPQGWVQENELAYASRQVNSIEINGSFYSLQRPSSYQSWYEQTPPGFVFSIKCPRFITHIRRLREVETPLANFYASGVLRLREKIGPFLWQFPPSFAYEPDRLAAFFALLPRTVGEASVLARGHDDHLKARAVLKTEVNFPLQHAIEVRHPSFENASFIALLREHRVGLVIADTAGKWPFMEDVTADFVYVRLHGDEELYVSGYTEPALESWAGKIRAWRDGKNPAKAKILAPAAPETKAGRSVFVYFDNDVKVRAPYDAMTLAHKLGLGPPPAEAPAIETIDELPRVDWPAYTRPKPREASAP